jgi:hypothetical protein
VQVTVEIGVSGNDGPALDSAHLVGGAPILPDHLRPDAQDSSPAALEDLAVKLGEHLTDEERDLLPLCAEYMTPEERGMLPRRATAASRATRCG